MGCKFNGCTGIARGDYCPAHYQQKRQGKVLKPLQVQYHGLTESERFFKRVKIGKRKDCWNWTGSRNSTHWHGQWRNGAGEIELAHRAMWRLCNHVPIPPGMCLLHRCDNPICVNLDHLFIGTQSDNALDMWSKNRAKPGASKGEKHGMSKLTEDLVRDIRTSIESGVELARRLNLATTTICDIRKRRTWKHIV